MASTSAAWTGSSSAASKNSSMTMGNLHGPRYPHDSFGDNKATTDYMLTDYGYRIAMRAIGSRAVVDRNSYCLTAHCPTMRQRAAASHFPSCSRRNCSRLVTTRRQVRAHSCRVMWVAASQSRRHWVRWSTLPSPDLTGVAFFLASAFASGFVSAFVSALAPPGPAAASAARTSIGESASSGVPDWLEATLARARMRQPARIGRRMGWCRLGTLTLRAFNLKCRRTPSGQLPKIAAISSDG